ncbi:hypothetical protein AAFF_G00374320 [Aldrovandia affinis]|uniref:Uncharacterized protein n=1 Tax=Aldrovandia affinis TaxID=143900 RepID=A0AAD7SFY6_9TELE|nr:hypothetical protein AAFF_G00374320 [Aldrovandia affinis]
MASFHTGARLAEKSLLNAQNLVSGPSFTSRVTNEHLPNRKLSNPGPAEYKGPSEVTAHAANGLQVTLHLFDSPRKRGRVSQRVP